MTNDLIWVRNLLGLAPAFGRINKHLIILEKAKCITHFWCPGGLHAAESHLIISDQPQTTISL